LSTREERTTPAQNSSLSRTLFGNQAKQEKRGSAERPNDCADEEKGRARSHAVDFLGGGWRSIVCTMSRGKNNSIVQSPTTRTLRSSPGSLLRSSVRQRNQPKHPLNL